MTASRSWVLFILSFVLLHAHAQKRSVPSGVAFFGNVTDHKAGSVIPVGTVRMLDIEDSTFQMEYAMRNGKYDLILPYDQLLLIEYEAVGYITKSIEINTKGVAEKQRKGGFGIQVDAVLIEDLEGLDHAILKLPFGKSAYDPRKKIFQCDREYTRGLREQQQKLIEEHERRRKELQKQ